MTGLLRRNIPDAAGREHGVIVVGGGIYGAFVALEAARRGLHPLLIERADFGGATSRASLRIVHGGLRYLQSLDLRRCRESAGERAWMLREFPDLVRPLTCLLPLYGRILRRPAAFRLALAVDRLVTRGAAQGGGALPPGEVLSAGEVADLFPLVERTGLRGGGLWRDGLIACPERLIIEVLRWAVARGAIAVNYVEAVGLLRSGPVVAGVAARDLVTGRTVEFRAPAVINCAGPWCVEVGRRLDRDLPSLFRPSLAFNVLLDMPPPCPHAVAVAPPRRRAGLYFLVPCHGRVMAGTVHLPCDAENPRTEPAPEQIDAFLSDLAAAIPGWTPALRHVVAVLAGNLPADAPGSARQCTRPVILDHASLSPPGPRGLWSVSGVKFTTARRVAETVVRRAFPRRGREIHEDTGRPPAETWPALLSPDGLLREVPGVAADRLRAIVEEEAVVHLDDLILRRSAWGLDPSLAAAAAERACDLLGIDEPDRQSEMARLKAALGPLPEPVRSAPTYQVARGPTALAPAFSGRSGRGGVVGDNGAVGSDARIGVAHQAGGTGGGP